jgi:hypothetical protein
MYAVLVVKLNQFEETKGVFRRNKSKNDKNSLSDNPMYVCESLAWSSEIKYNTKWLYCTIICSEESVIA